MPSVTHIIMLLLIVFIATFTLFYIFDNLDKLSNACEAGEPLAICGQLNSFTVSMLVILLIIGGFVLVISAVVYIMLSG